MTSPATSASTGSQSRDGRSHRKAGGRIRAPFDSEIISLKTTRHSTTIDNVKAKIDNVEGKDSGQGGEKTLVKTHTSKTSSLRPVDCISDQFPTRGIPTTSLCLARQVSTSHDKSPPRTRSPTPAGMWDQTHNVNTTTDAEERFPTSCRYNSWQPCKQLTPTRALVLV
jgi:hypothetical protein